MKGLENYPYHFLVQKQQKSFLSCKEPVRFLEEETDEEDDFEEFDFMDVFPVRRY